MFSNNTVFNQPINKWNINPNCALTHMFYVNETTGGTSPMILSYDTDITPEYSFFNKKYTSPLIDGDENTEGSLRWAMSKYKQGLEETIYTEYGPPHHWNITNITDVSHVFMGVDEYFPNVNSWDIKNITNMSYMFADSSFNRRLLYWDISHVEYFEYFMKNNRVYNERFDLHGIDNWRTLNAISMEGMFYGATSFNQEIVLWYPRGFNEIDSKLVNISNMFNGATSFNSKIVDFQVNNVTNASYMFKNASSFNYDVRYLNFSLTKDISFTNMFEGATSYDYFFTADMLPELKTDYYTPNIKYFITAFRDGDIDTYGTARWAAKQLSDGLFQTGTYLQRLFGYFEDWNMYNITDASHMFENLNGVYLNQSNYGEPYVILNWTQPGNITNMSYMFHNSNFNGDITCLNVKNVLNMEGMFKGSAFNHPLPTFPEGTKVTNMSYMFADSSFNQEIDSTLFNVEYVETIEGMFSGDSHFNSSMYGVSVPNLKNMSHYVDGNKYFNQPIIYNDTNKLENISYMFANSIFDSHINTDLSNVTTIEGLYKNNKTPLQNVFIKLNNIITAKDAFKNTTIIDDMYFFKYNTIESMEGMFENAVLSDNNDIKKWDVSGVKNMKSMFRGSNCNLDLLMWETGQVTTMEYMFADSSNNQNYQFWDVSNVTDTSFTDMFKNTPFETNNLIGTKWETGVDKTFFRKLELRNKDLINYEGTIQWAVNEYISGYFSSRNENVVKYGYIEDWDTSKVTDMYQLFSNISFNANISNWDVGNVTIMSSMFSHNTVFNQDISGWDVRNVRNMSNMFYGATAFDQPLNDWDVSNVTDMNYMFYGATSFDQPLNDWDVGNVTVMNYMFKNATSFNQPLNNWNVEKVTNMISMFEGATSFNSPIDGWKLYNCINIKLLFSGATAFNQPLNNWDVSNVEIMAGIFKGAISFNQPLNNWDVRNVRNMSFMFNGATAFDQPLNDWDVGNVTDMISMFEGATSFNQDISIWKTNSLIHMRKMFKDATLFNSRIGGWDVSGVFTMDELFKNAISFNNEIRRWKVTKVYTFENMFEGATLFKDVYEAPDTPTIAFFNAPNIPLYNGLETTYGSFKWALKQYFDGNIGLYPEFGDTIGDWNVIYVTDMTEAFKNRSSFNEDISGWSVQNVTNMTSMFEGATSFNQDISGWSVQNVTNMTSMFEGATSFNQDITHWNTEKVQYMNYMFKNATSFSYDILVWNISSVKELDQMFNNATTFISLYNYFYIHLSHRSGTPTPLFFYMFRPYRKPYCCPPKAIPHNMNTSMIIVQKSTKMKRAQRLKRMSRR
jgi:surface protein